ncbi:MAG: hypothetical protein ACT4PS_09770 [Betaproteobacteria bacterium]
MYCRYPAAVAETDTCHEEAQELLFPAGPEMEPGPILDAAQAARNREKISSACEKTGYAAAQQTGIVLICPGRVKLPESGIRSRDSQIGLRVRGTL